MKKIFSLLLSFYLSFMHCQESIAKTLSQNNAAIKITQIHPQNQKTHFAALTSSNTKHTQKIITDNRSDIKEQTKEKPYKERSVTCINRRSLWKVLLACLAASFVLKAIDRTVAPYKL